MAWQDTLLPASFRGVPFYVDGHDYKGGRRAVQHEYPGRDRPSSEDMGRKGRSFRLRAYVIGDDCMLARDALVHACEGQPGPGLLVHPYLGQTTVQAGLLGMRESPEEGGVCEFDLEFLESGRPTPIAKPSSAQALIAWVLSAAKLAMAVYGEARAIVADPVILLGMVEELAAAAFATLADFAAAAIDLEARPSIAGYLPPHPNPNTSRIPYNPGGRPSSHNAARTAPAANTRRSTA